MTDILTGKTADELLTLAIQCDGPEDGEDGALHERTCVYCMAWDKWLALRPSTAMDVD